MTDEDQKPNQPPPSQKLFIDISGRGGLAPRWFGDEGDTTMQHPEYRYIGTQDQTTPTLGESTGTDMAAGIWNSSRRYGFMAPANNTFNAVTNSTGSPFVREIRATCYDPLTHTAFYAENQNPTSNNGCSIYQNSTITANTWTLNSNFSWPLTTSLGFTDVEMYMINGIPYVFASYMSATSYTDILVMLPGGGSSGASNVWLSSVASGSFNMPWIYDSFFIRSSYYMYIVGGDSVHRLDGSKQTGGINGTALSYVLTLPSSESGTAQDVFTDGISWNGNIWLSVCESPPTFQGTSLIWPPDDATYSSSKCNVFVWDESVTSIEDVNNITVTGVKLVSKLFVTKAGQMRMLCISSKRTVQIRQYNGVTFDVLEEFSIGAAPRFRKSVQVSGNTVVWTGGDGNIYSYGPVTNGESEQPLIIGSMSSYLGNSTNFLGATLFLDNNNSATTERTGLFVSTYNLSNTTIYNLMWYPNQIGNTPHTGNVFTLVKYFPQLVKVNYVRVYHHQGTSSTSTAIQGTLGINFNGTTTGITSNITLQDVGRGFKYIPVNQGAKNALFGIQFNINWNISTTTSDSTDWLPRSIEIDYTPLEKLM